MKLLPRHTFPAGFPTRNDSAPGGQARPAQAVARDIAKAASAVGLAPMLALFVDAMLCGS